MNMTSKSDCISVTCTRLRHFAVTFSQWNSCWKINTHGHMAENKCGYQKHIFVTSLSSQHAPVWRCFCMVQPLRQPFRPKCTNRIMQMHHQNPVVPPESGVHPQNPVCTYSVRVADVSRFTWQECGLPCAGLRGTDGEWQGREVPRKIGLLFCSWQLLPTTALQEADYMHFKVCLS